MRKPEPPENGHTTADYSPLASPLISQRTAYQMLSALKLVVALMDMHGSGILGTMGGQVRAAMRQAERESSQR